MVSSLPNLVDNLALLKKFVKLNLNMDMIIKNVKLLELNTKIKSAVMNIHTNSEDDLIECKCLYRNKDY